MLFLKFINPRKVRGLEISVHLDVSEALPNDRYDVEIDIPDDVKILELRTENLREHWDIQPPALETQYIGDDFVIPDQAAVLKVPSSIVSAEYNYLINPNHQHQARLITVISKSQLICDQRFKKAK